MSDIHIYNDQSVIMVYPITQKAKDWVDENVDLEDWQWFGYGFAVHPRYIDHLTDGMINDGLEIE